MITEKYTNILSTSLIFFHVLIFLSIFKFAELLDTNLGQIFMVILWILGVVFSIMLLKKRQWLLSIPLIITTVLLTLFILFVVYVVFFTH
ncbi:hypothetical protein [Niallia taxi]|uniref:hypothetical protein n=1 Tax=Niallia taxi TaxID=2499688 RepID=UPI002E1B0D6E|nr:hypothetical protein [Niallia taxi]